MASRGGFPSCSTRGAPKDALEGRLVVHETRNVADKGGCMSYCVCVVSIVRTSARSLSHASPRPQHVPNGVFHCSSYRSSAASYSFLEFGTRDSSFRRIFGSSAYASNRRFASSLNPSASPSFTRIER